MKTPIQVFFTDHHLLHLAVESTSERKPFSSGVRSLLGGWGVWESVFVWTSPTVCDGHPSPRRARIIFWEDGFCDLTFGSAQNDKSEAYCEGWKFSNQRIQPKRNLLLWALIMDWCNVHWYWVDAFCIGYGLKLGILIFDWFMSFLNSILKCNFTSRQEGWANEESAPFNPGRKRGTDKNLQPTQLTLMSLCTEGLPGVAESTISISHRMPLKVYKL